MLSPLRSFVKSGAPVRRFVWQREVARLYSESKALASDFDKVTFLREYCGALIPIGRPDDRTRSLYQSVDFAAFDPATFYPLFRSYSLSAQCGITSFFYIKLLRALGFKAYQYSFGFTDKPYDRFIHSVALVEIGFRGSARRLIIQDPYFNLTYRTRDGEPADFFEFLAMLKRRQYERIVMDSPPLETFLLVPDMALYYPYLNEDCKKQMAEALTREDGSLATRMPITRNYASLMQSPCGGSENAFLEALRQHGFDEPFVYAYTLRASEIVGNCDHLDLQRKIDANLR